MSYMTVHVCGIESFRDHSLPGGYNKMSSILLPALSALGAYVLKYFGSIISCSVDVGK